MQARAKLLGHPVHQMLIPLPLGLFISAAVIDIVSLVRGVPTLPQVSYWNAVGGIITALVAAVFGFADWTAIPKNTRAKRIGAAHGIGNVLVVTLFAAAVFLRMGDPYYVTGVVPTLFEIAGLLLGAVTGWLGGELVDRLGIGVDPGANVDASSSLRTDRPVQAR